MSITLDQPRVQPVTLETQSMPLVLTAVTPIHHGAGAAGNTAKLRTQQIVLPNGTRTAVPFISGNSVRHAIRDALAWRLARLLDIPADSLPKSQVDLLWSGGAVTKTGSQVDLQLARDLAAVPELGLLGYSAQSDIVPGCLWADNLNLVCAENAWRLPPHLRDHPHAAVPAGRLREEHFGTRHDIAGSAPSLLVETGMLDTPAPATTQMIYAHQVLVVGAVLWGDLTLAAAGPLQRDALHTALHDLTPGGVMRLGARRSAGWGGCRVHWPATTPDPDAVARHDAHVLAHREAILGALAAATA